VAVATAQAKQDKKKTEGRKERAKSLKKTQVNKPYDSLQPNKEAETGILC